MDTRQTNIDDPGLQSLKLVAAHFDKVLCVRSLQHRLGLRANVADELDLCRCASWVGLKARVQRISLDRVQHLPMPAITNFDGHYCVMLASTSDSVVLQHPLSRQEIEVSLQEWAQHSEQDIILFAETSLEKGLTKCGFSWFMPSLIKHVRQVKSILLISAFIQLIALVTPFLLQNVIDKVLINRSLSSLQVLAIGMLALAIYEPVFLYLRSWLFANLSGKLSAESNSRLYRHLLALPLSFFNQYQTGQITARMREMDKVHNFLSGSALSMVLDLIFICVFIAVLFSYAPMLTWVVIASLLLYFLFWLSIGPILRHSVNRHSERSADSSAFLNQTISGIETIKSNAIEQGFIKEWQTNLAQQLKAGFKARLISIWAQQGVSLIQKSTTVLLLWWGVKSVLDGELSAGELVAFNLLAVQVTQPILRLAQLWQEFQHMLISLRRIGEILAEKAEVGSEGMDSTPEIQGSIRFSQVRFRYHSDAPQVLRNISFEIKAGEFIGITGSSGSGKSTLTKLLQRLYSPDSGVVYIDGLDVAITDPLELRRGMSVVLQESHLFSGTIGENIRQCTPQASDEEVVYAAKLAGAHSFITQLPLGYNTPLAERGNNLSGGQRQRIALARALITRPKILILDEATSALDYESEAAIISRLSEIRKGRTVISIAHRLNTIQQCDRILVIEDGQIQESGDHHSLLKQQQQYAQLWANQVG